MKYMNQKKVDEIAHKLLQLNCQGQCQIDKGSVENLTEEELTQEQAERVYNRYIYLRNTL